MKLALVLLIPLMLFSAWQFARREENENRLALVASEVALRDVDVSCPGFWTRLVEITPNAGWVNFDEHGLPEDETSLSADTCASLERVWRDRRAEGRDAEWAVVTLAHESWHLRGVTNEARTQCYAIQTVEPVARALGVPTLEARLLAARVAFADARTADGEYHSTAACRPGGAYDLRPATAAWPSG